MELEWEERAEFSVYHSACVNDFETRREQLLAWRFRPNRGEAPTEAFRKKRRLGGACTVHVSYTRPRLPDSPGMQPLAKARPHGMRGSASSLRPQAENSLSVGLRSW